MPVKFITIDRGVGFQIRYGVRRMRSEKGWKSREDLMRFHELFAEFLTACGLGAKTRKGYGRMEVRAEKP